METYNINCNCGANSYLLVYPLRTDVVVSEPRFALLVLMDFQIHTIQGIEDVLDELDYRAMDGKNRLGPPYSI
ncbi:hypothetical protein BDV40DRAFT_308796 [Aspergillus tamarii]|uniref:Uncharacterized protein n=1 Tax=Aspergillus tamarii TaxID=41984 RepID=A0A5N6UFE3_ASPTM|nr:hypothetical protein BDV40DRAFT_308796 [Aspergillus tamarii]